MTTIKEHLAAIREVIEYHHDCCSFEESRAHWSNVLDDINAIEAELDRPMMSAEEWMEEWLSAGGFKGGPKELIRRVQQDACRSVLSDKTLCISKTPDNDIQQTESVDAQERGAQSDD